MDKLYIAIGSTKAKGPRSFMIDEDLGVLTKWAEDGGKRSKKTTHVEEKGDAKAVSNSEKITDFLEKFVNEMESHRPLASLGGGMMFIFNKQYVEREFSKVAEEKFTQCHEIGKYKIY